MKHIIFDIGNVLLEFQPQAFLQKYFAPPAAGNLLGIIFGSAEWAALDQGTMTTSDAIQALAGKHPRYREEIAFVLKTWTQMLTPLPQNVAAAQALKRSGYTLYLLSNFHKEAWEAVLARYDFFRLFDGRVISCYEHCTKPDPKIYRLLLQRYRLNAGDSLFIDDMPANIQAAETAGLHGLCLPYGADLRPALQARGLLLSAP